VSAVAPESARGATAARPLPRLLPGRPPREGQLREEHPEREDRTETRFRAMGTDCHVALLGGDGADLELAVERVRELESLWSRFVADSEISRLNHAGGTEVRVSSPTRVLLQRALEARTRTKGWFDPFLAAALEAQGYDRDFSTLEPALPLADGTTAPVARPAVGQPLFRRAPLSIGVPDASGGATARLAAGAAFDPGGIGKGLAADLVATELVRAGVAGALVNLGGDLRVAGRAPEGGWAVTIDHPVDGDLAPVATIRVAGAGLCTSSALRRRWRAPDGSAAHHVLDPRTGRPADIAVASVTVTAPEAWVAETLTTAVMLAGPVFGAALLRKAGAEALVVGLDGAVGTL
jgi:FAD:protein FMN transferase